MNASPGPVCLILPVVALIAYWVVRSRAAESRPERVGYIAAAVGLAGFVPALMAPEFSRPGETGLLAGAGVLTVLLAVAGIALAWWTFQLRKREPGGVSLYPTLACLFGLANLACGGGIVATGFRLLVPTGGTPWTWRSETHGIDVTIPSERWTVQPNPNVLGYFTCPRPLTMAIVAEALPAGTDAELDAAVAKGKKMAPPAVAGRDERSRVNDHGQPYWMSLGETTGPKGPYVLGVSVTRVRDKAVLLMFEGQYRLTSEAGRAQEAEALRASAATFLASVR
ncbi:hypothetical protein J0H58_29280 [bacterium]|nr:hypothetical protein [bacterium]